ncbi:hypothetical protein B0H13DRAFT_2345098 [Mycena leptocephala]|nr:hypothetical protein B0H13DRAFT_2345098 [Mycena leptocephala]
MPDASTQTEQSIIDEIELQFKQEAVMYFEGRSSAAPSAGMLHWLGSNLAPAKGVGEDVPFKFTSLLEQTGAEVEEMAGIRKRRVELLMKMREGWEERTKKKWPRLN